MQSIERTLVIWVFLTLTAGVALAASESPTWLPAPPDVLEQLDLDRGDLQKIDVSAAGPALHANVRLGGETFGLVLHRVSLRGDHFEVLVPGVDGTLRPVEVPAPQTYQGYLEGSVSGRVAASWSGTELTALILLDDGSAWAVQPAPGRPGWSVVYVSEDVRDGDWHCGNDLLPQIEQSGQPAPPTTSGIGDKVCQIAFDADREFWAKNGSSVSATVNDIENILNGVVTVYERDVNITYELSTIIVRTSEPDPYSSSDAGTLLDQFENYWAANHGGIHRDIAHLMTGKNINGGTIGVAWVGTICSGPRSYGLSESRFTSNFNRRVTLTAHELGHNWSAPHCNGDGDCHIMCSGLGGCNGIGLPNFGINSAAQIISFSNSTSCTPSEPAPASIATPFLETWDDQLCPSS
ncbi:MAG: M12 family metallo-peptidase [Planctomycetota bacterium]